MMLVPLLMLINVSTSPASAITAVVSVPEPELMISLPEPVMVKLPPSVFKQTVMIIPARSGDAIFLASAPPVTTGQIPKLRSTGMVPPLPGSTISSSVVPAIVEGYYVLTFSFS